MKNVSQLVREKIIKYPFIIECIKLSLINFSALAEFLKPEIENEYGGKVETMSISVALRRYEKKLKKMKSLNIDVESDIELTSKSNLMEWIVNKSSTIYLKLNKIITSIQNSQDKFLQIIHGTDQISIIFSEKNHDKIKEILKNQDINEQFDNLGAIYMSIPSKYRQTEGYLYRLTLELAFHNINILTIANINTQVLFIFLNEDVPKAFKVLYELINL